MSQKNKQEFTFSETRQTKRASGRLKVETTIELSDYDTSKMGDYKEGNEIFRGQTLHILTMKPSKSPSEQEVYLDPEDENQRDMLKRALEIADKRAAERKKSGK